MQYIIIGGVAGGASTAARLRRMDEKADIILFEKGAYISYANCGLPYYIGDVINDRNKLFVQTAASFKSRFNIDVRVMSEVTSIDAAAKKITIKNITSGNVYEEQYDKLVLSPGAEPIRPGLEGVNTEGIFTLRNVADTDRIKEYVQKHILGKAVIIGAGFIGLEMAENLHHLGMEVTVVEMGDQILAPADFTIAAIAQQHLRSKGVKLKLKTTVTGFEKIKSGIKVLIKDDEPIDADVVILSIGVKPDTKLAIAAGLQVNRGIVVTEFLQTSDKNIYAVGDAIEFINPVTGNSMPTFLAGPANKQGRICADNIVLGNKHTYNGSINTAIVKLFDLTVAVAGVASKHLTAAGIEHKTAIVHSNSHAGYYPGAQQLSIQIAFSPKDGKLLGAQAAGINGVDKRIDILSSVIQRGSTIYELTEFEHAYAPPYSSAKDPVNMAGFVAENILLGRLRTVAWNKTQSLNGNDILLDVRTPQEFENGHIEGAINIPLDELRNRLHELHRHKTIYVYCQIGLRGYLAQRILLQNDFENIFNIAGGFYLWNICQKETELLEIAIAV